MRGACVSACLIALASPRVALAEEGDAAAAGAPAARATERAASSRAEPPSAAHTELGAEAAHAIRAARADLDRLVQSLLQDQGATGATAAPDLQLEVVPPSLTSETPARAEPPAQPPPDFAWLHGIELPDIQARWHPLLLDQLTYYRDDPRGRAHIRAWMQRAGRYEDMIRRKLRDARVPEDLLYVAMVESSFDPNTVSHAGAVGIWQLVENTAVDYGIEKTRWLDERRSPERSTEAAAQFLKELYGKLGSWPLSLAAYNMGYGALLRSIRKYNTNDFWQLARVEAGLPYETVIYVVKIMACAIVAHNPERFGLADLRKDPAVTVSYVEVPGGLGLGRLASAAGITAEAMAALNPELTRKRVPPDVQRFTVRIPVESAERFTRRYPEIQAEPTHATHVLRFGERLSDVAEMYGTTERKLRALNDLEAGESVRPGTRLRVPDVEKQAPVPPAEPHVVGIPDQVFDYDGRRKLFYRVQSGDSAAGIAGFFQVSLDELRMWNAISTDSALHSGMILQLFVPESVDLAQALYLPPEQVRPLIVGSDEFFDHHEALRDRVRIRYRVQSGDTLSSLAERYELSVGSIARINGFSRAKTLQAGAEIILYVPSKDAPQQPAADARQAQRE
jgi:membrane-bound lytic murein transglycosylase D